MAAVTTTVAAIGTVAAAAGTAATVVGQQQSADAQADAESARKKSANLDARRRQRQVIREGILARSQALANATSQGAEGGSGLQGGYGQISGQTNTNLAGNFQQQALGSQVFRANARAQSGATVANIGQGLSSLGDSLVKNRETIGTSYESIFS